MESGLGTRARGTFARRLATETKQAFKTTEFWAFLVILVGLWIAGAVTGGGDASSATGTGTSTGTTGVDSLPAGKVWLYTVILAVGYMVARGLAKAGSRDPYWDEPSSGSDGGSFADRVKTAAQVLKEGDVPSQSAAPAGTSTGVSGEGSTQRL
jgi:hypothetical protein